MSDPIKLFEGDQRFEALYQALKALVYERGSGLPVPGIIGTIELVKIDILKEASNEA